MVMMIVLIIVLKNPSFHMTVYVPCSYLNTSKYGLGLVLKSIMDLKRNSRSNDLWMSRGPRSTEVGWELNLYYDYVSWCFSGYHPKEEAIPFGHPRLEKYLAGLSQACNECHWIRSFVLNIRGICGSR